MRKLLLISLLWLSSCTAPTRQPSDNPPVSTIDTSEVNTIEIPGGVDYVITNIVNKMGTVTITSSNLEVVKSMNLVSLYIRFDDNGNITYIAANDDLLFKENGAVKAYPKTIMPATEIVAPRRGNYEYDGAHTIIVREGNNINDIIRDHDGVTLEKLLANNPHIKNRKNYEIYVGEKIILTQ